MSGWVGLTVAVDEGEVTAGGWDEVMEVRPENGLRVTLAEDVFRDRSVNRRWASEVPRATLSAEP